MGAREAVLHHAVVLHGVLRAVHAGAVPQRGRAAPRGAQRAAGGGPAQRPGGRHRRAHQLDVQPVLRQQRAVGRRDPQPAVLGHGQRDHAAAGRQHHLSAAGRGRQRGAGQQRRADEVGEHQLAAGPARGAGRRVGAQAAAAHGRGDAVRRGHRHHARVHHAPGAPRGRRPQGGAGRRGGGEGDAGGGGGEGGAPGVGEG
mmetsp:Transcript_41661/g.102648  ORF Transcript_41661/g.102648 Transcript_41661/m.102648 type:complete len:200 (-) Transcript_41661:762-1361(-)